MNFKKILFSILAVFMLVIAVACGKKEAPTEDANAQQEAASEVATQDIILVLLQHQFHNQKIISVEQKQF